MERRKAGLKPRSSDSDAQLAKDAASFLAHHHADTPDAHFYEFEDRMVVVLPAAMGQALAESLHESGWQGKDHPSKTGDGPRV